MNEAKVQRYAYLALGAAYALALVAAGRGSGVAFGVAIPFVASAVIATLGAGVCIAGIVRRSNAFALSGALVLALALVPASELAPGLVGNALAIAFGGAVLLFAELVHQTARYARAKKLASEEGLSEESLDRVTNEALRTLFTRAALALGLTGAGAGVAIVLSVAGPKFFQDGIESQAPLGVAVWTLFLFSILALYVLVRGAKFPKLPERLALRKRKTLPVDHLEVVAADAVE